MNTIAGLIAETIVLNSVVAELAALLTPEQRRLLSDRLRDHTDDLRPIDEFEPECSEIRRTRFAQWIDGLAPKP